MLTTPSLTRRLPPAALSTLARACGNRAIQRLARGGPLRLQRRVQFIGFPSGLRKTQDLVQGALPHPSWIAQIDANGLLTFSPSPDQGPPNPTEVAAKEFATRTKALVDDPATVQETVYEHANAATKTPFVGSFTMSRIDIDDLIALGTDVGAKGSNGPAALIHELTEQYEKQVKGSDYANAHRRAAAAELAVIGATLESETSTLAPSGPDQVSGQLTSVFRYPNGDRWQVLVTVVNNDVTAVVRTQLPASTPPTPQHTMRDDEPNGPATSPVVEALARTAATAAAAQIAGGSTDPARLADHEGRENEEETAEDE